MHGAVLSLPSNDEWERRVQSAVEHLRYLLRQRAMDTTGGENLQSSGDDETCSAGCEASYSAANGNPRIAELDERELAPSSAPVATDYVKEIGRPSASASPAALEDGLHDLLAPQFSRTADIGIPPARFPANVALFGNKQQSASSLLGAASLPHSARKKLVSLFDEE